MKISGIIQKIRSHLRSHCKIIGGSVSILVFIPVLLIPGCGAASGTEAFELQDFKEEEIVGQEALPVGVGEDFIYVYVCGRVSKPGVYSVSENCRMFEVLQMAGGALPDADISGINQAGKLSDGQQIYVPSVEEVRLAARSGEEKSFGTGPFGSSAGGVNDGLVNINSADLTELTTIPGIGNTRAQAILDYRSENGRFEKAEDIMKVPGIKEGLYSKISARIKVD